MFIAGYVSGGFTPGSNQSSYSGAKQGLITWSISILLMLSLTGILGVILPINLQAISSFTDNTVQIQNSKNQTEPTANLQYPSEEEQRIIHEKNASLLAALSLQAFLILFIGALACALGSEISSRNSVIEPRILSQRGA